MNKKIDIAFKRLNHIQLCISKNKEAEAKAFYCDLLGLEEVEKPVYLQKNGGFWLKIADIELHIGTEESTNTSKRHPAFEVLKLNSIKKDLTEAGISIKEDRSLPMFHRFSFYDPFNNRIELLEAKTKEEIEFLGKEVVVTIDRPIKSKHPEFNFDYHLNYGYLANTKSGDGKEIDAYIFGETNPIKEFKGIVKGVIIRYNDNENKLIVANDDLVLDENMIIEQTFFQEQYFDIEVKLSEH